MALIGNGSVLHKSPGRFLNGYGTTGGGIASMRCGLNKHGMQRNAYQSFYAKSATPDGHLSPSAWVLPKTAGGMSSRNVTALSLAPTASMVGGVTTTGTSTLTFTVSDAAGQLISSGSGAASLAFTFANALLTASLNGIGEASFTLSTNTPPLGAEASGTGAASFTITGALVPYAIGSMSGSTVDTATLTTAAILAAMNASPPGVNIKLVNGVAVTGDGQPGTEWGPQ